MTTTYRQAFDLACAQGHPRGSDGSVAPSFPLAGCGATTVVMLHPDHEWAAEICVELGDSHFEQLIDRLMRVTP